jgi:hypothetical protein
MRPSPEMYTRNSTSLDLGQNHDKHSLSSVLYNVQLTGFTAFHIGKNPIVLTCTFKIKNLTLHYRRKLFTILPIYFFAFEK